MVRHDVPPEVSDIEPTDSWRAMNDPKHAQRASGLTRFGGESTHREPVDGRGRKRPLDSENTLAEAEGIRSRFGQREAATPPKRAGRAARLPRFDVGKRRRRSLFVRIGYRHPGCTNVRVVWETTPRILSRTHRQSCGESAPVFMPGAAPSPPSVRRSRFPRRRHV